MAAHCASQASSRISSTSVALRTKEAAIKSTPCSIPNMMSLASFSVIPGSEICTPGTLTPFLLLIWTAVHDLAIDFRALNALDGHRPIKPSSIRIVEPTCNVGRQIRVRNRNPIAVAQDFFCRERDRLALNKLDRFFLQLAKTNFWTFGIKQDRYVSCRVPCRLGECS